MATFGNEKVHLHLLNLWCFALSKGVLGITKLPVRPE
jgi:hypothetical protein